MTSPEVAPEIVRFYSETIDEADRLSTTADGRLELVRTQELLRRHLPPPPARILDVGGGPGVHARWLVADGYHVHLVDPIPRHLSQAERVGATVELGDARHLTAEDASYDVVLLLGPLYHLPDRTDRDRALAEAHRVLKPGGLLAAAGINRYASLFEHTAFAHLHKEPLRESISGILATQIHDGKKAFTKAYFHSGAQLLDEVTTAGFTHTQVYGIEGPAWSLLAATERHTGKPLTDSPLFESALTAARLAEPYPELLAASSHLLAVGNRLDSSPSPPPTSPGRSARDIPAAHTAKASNSRREQATSGFSSPSGPDTPQRVRRGLPPRGISTDERPLGQRPCLGSERVRRTGVAPPPKRGRRHVQHVHRQFRRGVGDGRTGTTGRVTVTRTEYYDDPNAPEPNSMVVAASAVVTDGQGRILLQRRRDNDLWALPGGGMDLADSLPGTAVREVKEETGLEVEITGLVGTYTDPKHIIAYTDGEVRRQFNICFTARIIGGRLEISDESTELRFVPPADLDELPMHHTQQLRLEHFLERPYLG